MHFPPKEKYHKCESIIQRTNVIGIDSIPVLFFCILGSIWAPLNSVKHAMRSIFKQSKLK